MLSTWELYTTLFISVYVRNFPHLKKGTKLNEKKKSIHSCHQLAYVWEQMTKNYGKQKLLMLKTKFYILFKHKKVRCSMKETELWNSNKIIS